MKCVHSVVLSKTLVNACVSERKVVCTAVVNRLEKRVDFHAMIKEKFWFHSSAGLGVVQVNAHKALCNAPLDPLLYLNLVRSSQEHLESYSVPPNHVG